MEMKIKIKITVKTHHHSLVQAATHSTHPRGERSTDVGYLAGQELYLGRESG